MRKFIDIITGLTEAPIADFQFHGSPDIPGTFEKNDLVTMSKGDWRARLLKRFDKVPEPINLYIMNFDTDKWVNSQVGHKQFSIKPPSNLANFRDWNERISGIYLLKDFETNFGFVPPNASNSINVVLTHNFGDEKVPLTPWMVAHRIVHACATNSNEHYTRRNGEVVIAFNRFFNKLQDVMDNIATVDGQPFQRDVIAVAKIVSNLKSARNGNIARSGEFYVELATQFLLTGDFVFDLDALAAAKHFDALKTESIAMLLEDAKRYLQDWRALLLGKIFIL